MRLLEDQALGEPVTQAAHLLATVLGQDLTDDDGVFRIARKVAADRVISTVDPQARHGHKTNSRSFAGYRGHIAIDPDAEIITATEAEAQAAVYGDAAYGAGELLARLDNAGVHNGLKVQPPSRVKGPVPQDRFDIDLDTGP